MAVPRGRKSSRNSGEAKISKADIRKYQRLVDRQAEKGAAFVDSAMASYMRRHPNATVAEVRKFTYELMQDALPNFTDLAETLSCEFMEEVAARHGWGDVRPEIVGTTDYNLVNERLHYLAKKLTEGDEEKYRKGILDATRFYIRRAAQDSMVENCGKAMLRFARVPSGFETCAFCFMLASRGFVYRSELKAGLGHAYHPNCNCTIVPGAEGRTKIDGYDPQGMADRWGMCLDTLGGAKRLKDEWSILPEEKKAKWLEKYNGIESAAQEAWIANQVMREVETRDWHWLYTGEVPKVIYASKKVRNEILTHRPHEARTAERLSRLGFRCELGNDSKKTGKDNQGRTLFDGYADNPSGIELKTVLTSKNAYGAVKNYFDNSLKKKNLSRMVIDNSESKYLSDKSIIKAILELSELEEYSEVSRWVSILKKDEALLDVTKSQ